MARLVVGPSHDRANPRPGFSGAREPFIPDVIVQRTMAAVSPQKSAPPDELAAGGE